MRITGRRLSLDRPGPDRSLWLAIIVSLGLIGSCLTTAGGQSTTEPFVKYDASVGGYLQRLHGREGPLAWRSNYPGGWKAWQTATRQKHRQLLGLERIAADVGEHEPRVALKAPIAEQGYTRQLGEIETEPGVTLPFWLLRPSRIQPGDKLPLVICAHGHDADGWNTYAGVYKDDQHRQSTLRKDGDAGVQAVRRGYLVLVPATRGLASAASIPDVKGRHGNRPCRAQLIHCLLAGRTAVGERVWDTQRLLDWALSELPNVAQNKIVMLGNSGGGVLTVHTAAQDERITVAVPSCSFSSFTSSTGFVFHCDCCLLPNVQAELGDMSDIGALVAPRALLAVHGKQDSLHHFADVEAAMKRVRSVYESLDAAQRFSNQWGGEGHKFYPAIMWPFVEQQLKASRKRPEK